MKLLGGENTMRSRKANRRSTRKMRGVLSTLGGLALFSYADYSVFAQSLHQTYMPFTTDPSWTGINNRSGVQNYGWTNTDNTGNSVNSPDHTATGAGEIGG